MTPFALIGDFHYTINNQVIIGILFIAIFSSVGAFIFWNTSLKFIDVNRAGVFLNLEVVFTALISLLIRELLTVSQIVGALFVFIGLYFTTKKTAVTKRMEQMEG